jgi:hypothetical protein
VIKIKGKGGERDAIVSEVKEISISSRRCTGRVEADYEGVRSYR